MATIFLVIDHATAECLGIHAARQGTRWEAIATLQQAVRERFGRYEKDLFEGVGLKLRHDHGSQFVSHAFQDELVFYRSNKRAAPEDLESFLTEGIEVKSALEGKIAS